MKSFATLWKEIGDWFEANAGLPMRFFPGASEQEIQKAEAVMGMNLPSDFREHLALFNGQNCYDDEGNWETCGVWMPDCAPLLPLHQIVKQWEMDNRTHETDDALGLDGYVFRRLTDPKRIPIAGNQEGDGDLSYLDLAAGPAGTAGQLITLVSECDFVVVDRSFRGAVERYHELLCSGGLLWVDDDLVCGDGSRPIYESFAIAK